MVTHTQTVVQRALAVHLIVYLWFTTKMAKQEHLWRAPDWRRLWPPDELFMTSPKLHVVIPPQLQ
jgi:hypothetical protein